MRFGRRILAERRAEWAENYVDYKARCRRRAALALLRAPRNPAIPVGRVLVLLASRGGCQIRAAALRLRAAACAAAAWTPRAARIRAWPSACSPGPSYLKALKAYIAATDSTRDGFVGLLSVETARVSAFYVAAWCAFRVSSAASSRRAAAPPHNASLTRRPAAPSCRPPSVARRRACGGRGRTRVRSRPRRPTSWTAWCPSWARSASSWCSTTLPW